MMPCGIWMWPVGLVIFGLFVIGVAVLIMWLVRQLTISQASRADSAEEILRRRFAAGEISQADYEQAKRALGLR